MINVIKKRNLWFTISSITIVVGLVFIFLGGLKLGIDFTGGTLMQVTFEENRREDTSSLKTYFKIFPVVFLGKSLGNSIPTKLYRHISFLIIQERLFFPERLLRALDRQYKRNLGLQYRAQLTIPNY